MEWKLSHAALLMSMKERTGGGREEGKEEEEQRKYRPNRKCYTKINIATCRKIYYCFLKGFSSKLLLLLSLLCKILP